jgi:hypothetical protein
MPVEPKQNLSQYLIDRKIGGGIGEVTAATDT